MLDLALPLVQVMLQNFAQFMGKSTINAFGMLSRFGNIPGEHSNGYVEIFDGLFYGFADETKPGYLTGNRLMTLIVAILTIVVFALVTPKLTRQSLTGLAQNLQVIRPNYKYFW